MRSSLSRLRIALAAFVLAMPTSTAIAAPDGAASPTRAASLESAQALLDAAREASLRGEAEAPAAWARAEEAIAGAACTEREALRLRLHLLRTRMLWLDAVETKPGRAPSALQGDLDAFAMEASRIADADALLAYAHVYRAELLHAAGQGERAARALERALAAPARIESAEPRARAHALRAVLLEAEGRRDEAVESARRAVRSIATLRGRVGAADFLAFAEPIHEQLAGLLLQQSAARADAEQALLAEAVDVLEELRVAELREYFGDECLLNLEETTPALVPGALLLYPVLLEDRVELIVGEGERLERIPSPATPRDVEKWARSLRGRLQDPTSRRYRRPANALHDALIGPLGDRLDRPGLTLTVVATGALREIPIAALYDADSKRFLIEQVPIATLPSLRIASPQPIDPRRTRLLGLGLSEAREGFAALPAVRRELASAHEHFGGDARIDADFTEASFEAALDQRAYDIIHIASHGRFDARASESFLLTHDGRLALQELADIVARTRHRTSRPIELLALSACETAIGDERAVLGLAGVAVQSGARSAIATLWRVSDEAAASLFARFYAALAEPGQSRARALQRAQRALIAEGRFRHPVHWSAFMLVNSWL